MAGGKGSSGDDKMIGIFILGMLVIFIGWMLWQFYQYDIKNVIRWYRFGQIWLVQWFLPSDYQIPYGDGFMMFKDWAQGIPGIPKIELSDTVMEQMAVLAMTPLRWVMVVVLVCCGFWALLDGPATHFRYRHNLETIIRVQSKTFPVIAPFVKFNPNSVAPRPPGAPVPAELPLFAEALGPEEWLAYNSIPLPDGKLDKEAVAREFARQLGNPWRGPFYLPPYAQVLMAAFCLKAVRKRRDSDDLMGETARCWSHDRGLRLSGSVMKKARAVLKNRDMVGSTISKCNQHGYETTALLRALNTAREEGGVLASAQFVWLRGHDRNLWYALNNLGRQAVHIEALGAMAHYKMEKITMRPILTPKVDDAVNSIIEYMASDRARPVPKLDYSGSKKRGIKKVKERTA